MRLAPSVLQQTMPRSCATWPTWFTPTRRSFGAGHPAQVIRRGSSGAGHPARVIRVVQDNLNTHGSAALYATFPPQEAHRRRQRFAFHPTPKHGGWLNMAEIEISVLARGCLGRSCPDLDTLGQRAAALEAERNAQQRPLTWQFTTVQARERLHRLYPDPKIKLD